jgi:hypothetical protein
MVVGQKNKRPLIVLGDVTMETIATFSKKLNKKSLSTSD